MGYTCMEVRGKLTGAQISMSTMWDLGVKLSVQAWWWQTPLSTESSCQASTWCFNKNNVFPSSCLSSREIDQLNLTSLESCVIV